ncbi:MAG: hypothetical protein RIC55_28605 [Pirellulaceae bacterium]
MSLFDWVELGFADHDHSLEWFTGSFGVTIGDSIAATFGASYSHVFGPKVTLVCDPEDMLLSKLDEALPLVTGLLAGVGGNFNLNYSSVFNGTYFGPVVNVRRAPHDDKTSDNILAYKKQIDPASGAETDVVDKATSIAAAALSVLINAVAAALDLAIHFVYPKFGSKSESDESTIEGYGKTPEILKICCYTITSRLMAMLKMLEEKGSWADFAEQFVNAGKFILKGIGYTVAFCLVPVAIAIAITAVVLTLTGLAIAYSGAAIAGAFA